MQIYRVGGAVRDELLGRPVHETDWVVVGGTPEAMERRGFKRVGKDFPVFLHPDTGEEYALARTERKAGRGYYGFDIDAHPDVTLEEDLLRRDLTINAMAEDADGSIIDPYGGQADLQAKVLRHVSPAFAEDPLRVLRVARFAARYHHLGFRVADETLTLMRQMSKSGELESLARERIWQELQKGLDEPSPHILFRVLLDCGALPTLYPEWATSLDDRLLAALSRANEVDPPLENAARFALSCVNLTDKRCRALCEQLNPPRGHAQMARLLLRLAPLPAPESLDAGHMLEILETADVLRRPELIDAIIAIEQCRRGGDYRRFLDAAQAVQAVRAEQLAASGLSGKALGEALRHKRREAIEQLP